jgi:type I restriction enzyme M protein
MDFIAEGLKQNLIRIEDSGKYIVYLPQGKRRNFENPEERIQAETFLRLVQIYKYPAKRISELCARTDGFRDEGGRHNHVYEDDDLKSPLIVAECKQPSVK